MKDAKRKAELHPCHRVRLETPDGGGRIRRSCLEVESAVTNAARLSGRDPSLQEEGRVEFVNQDRIPVVWRGSSTGSRPPVDGPLLFEGQQAWAWCARSAVEPWLTAAKTRPESTAMARETGRPLHTRLSAKRAPTHAHGGREGIGSRPVLPHSPELTPLAPRSPWYRAVSLRENRTGRKSALRPPPLCSV